MDKLSKDNNIIISGYSLEISIKESLLSIKAKKSVEEYNNSFSNDDIMKKFPKGLFDNLEEIKQELENGEKNVELVQEREILRLNLKIIIKINSIKKEYIIPFDLKKNNEIEESIYDTNSDIDKERNDFFNQIGNKENNNVIVSSITQKKSYNNTNTNTNLYLEITNYNSYKCPFCNNIPKIIFINDNKIMINCCEKYQYKVIYINEFLDKFKEYIKNQKTILDYCQKCQKDPSKPCKNCQKEKFYCLECEKNLCEDCKKKNKVIMLENGINNLINSEIKPDKENSGNNNENKDDTLGLSNKTDDIKFNKPEPIIGDKNKNDPYSPECNQLINIIIHNSQFYKDPNHLENLENIFDFKSNCKDYKDKNKLIIEYKGQGEKEGISLFGNQFILNNKDKIKVFINQKEYKIEKGKYNIGDEKIIVMLVEKEKGEIEDMSYLFFKCTNIKSLIDGDKWDTSNVKYINNLFDECSSLEILSGISNWNIKNVTNMSGLFRKCLGLKCLPDISKWKTKNVTNMSDLFNGCSSLKDLPDISNWTTESLIDMRGIFSNCSKLQSLPDISKWNTENVTNMSDLFNKCSSLQSLPDISKWNTSKVKYMNNLFNECSSLQILPDISNWKIGKVTNMSDLFNECSSLQKLPDISKWKTESLIDMSGLFSNCSRLIQLPDISKWNTSNVKYINYLFNECSSLQNLPDISNWNTENIIYMADLFNECSSLKSLPDISKWNTINVLNMNKLFRNCSSLQNLPDISKWKLNNDLTLDNAFVGLSINKIPSHNNGRFEFDK